MINKTHDDICRQIARLMQEKSYYNTLSGAYYVKSNDEAEL